MTASKLYHATLLRPTDYKIMKWKNGKGSSSEIAIFPTDTQFPNDPFLWRISSAVLKEASSFSLFKGYHRYLTLLDEGQISLQINGKKPSCILKFGNCVEFAGDEEVFSELQTGPVRDLNLIFRKGQALAEFTIHKIAQNHQTLILQKRTAFIFLIAGTISFATEAKDEAFTLETNDTLRIDKNTNAALDAIIKAKTPEARFALIQLDYESVPYS